MLKALTQEQVDKISDDFQSTFTQVRPGVLMNMAFPKETVKIEELIRRHVPDVEQVNFGIIEEVSNNYYIWEFRIEQKD